MKLFDIKVPSELVPSVIIIIIAFVINLIIKKTINKIMKANIIKKSKIEERRAKTILMLIRKIVKYFIVFLTILSILSIWHVNTTAVVTSVGAVSVVIGLAFQDLLKDFLVGISIVFENDYSIGDYVEINGFKGEVTNFSLKSTRLKSLTGEVRIISNRQISELTNYSINKTNLLININVSYEDDIEKVEKVLKEVCLNIPNITNKVSDVVLCDGVEDLGDSSVIFKLSTYVNIKDIYYVKRIILKEVKMLFDKNNIKIPYPQVEVHNGK